MTTTGAKPSTGHDPKQRSREVTDGPERAPARAMLLAMGLTQEDLDPGYLLAVDPSQGFPVQGQGVIRLYPAICQPVADFCLKGRHVQKPFVSVANLASDVTPCNVHLDRLTQAAKEGVRQAGGTPGETLPVRHHHR